MTRPEFILDTSVLVMLSRWIPRDVNPGHWERLEELAGAQRLVMPRVACTELERGTDDCAAWAKSQAGLIVEPTAEEFAVVEHITADHPDWVSETKNMADPWIIAAAEVAGGVALTQETFSKPNTADRNLKLKTVALERGVECLNYMELARRLGWRFTQA